MSGRCRKSWRRASSVLLSGDLVDSSDVVIDPSGLSVANGDSDTPVHSSTSVGQTGIHSGLTAIVQGCLANILAYPFTVASAGEVHDLYHLTFSFSSCLVFPTPRCHYTTVVSNSVSTGRVGLTSPWPLVSYRCCHHLPLQ